MVGAEFLRFRFSCEDVGVRLVGIRIVRVHFLDSFPVYFQLPEEIRQIIGWGFHPQSFFAPLSRVLCRRHCLAAY
jgi:hypothetical protein